MIDPPLSEKVTQVAGVQGEPLTLGLAFAGNLLFGGRRMICSYTAQLTPGKVTDVRGVEVTGWVT